MNSLSRGLLRGVVLALVSVSSSAQCPVETGRIWRGSAEGDNLSLNINIKNISSREIVGLKYKILAIDPTQEVLAVRSVGLAMDIKSGKREVSKFPMLDHAMVLNNPWNQLDQHVGYIYYPTRILFNDGSIWVPREEGECYAVSLQMLIPLPAILKKPSQLKEP